MSREVIVISPHRDDAALSLGATLKVLTRRGADVTLVSCFTHSKWAPCMPGNTDQDFVTRIRATEDVRYLRVLGQRARLLDLGLLDGPLRKEWQSYRPEHPDIPVSDGYVITLRNRLLPLLASGGAWVMPLGLEHPDHVIARNAVLNLGAQAALAFYEDVPYTFWVPAEDGQHVIRELEKTAGVRLQPRVLHGLGDLRSWYKGARCYPSQFSARQVRSMVRLLRVRGGERIWVTDQFDAWLGSLWKE